MLDLGLSTSSKASLQHMVDTFHHFFEDSEWPADAAQGAEPHARAGRADAQLRWLRMDACGDGVAQQAEACMHAWLGEQVKWTPPIKPWCLPCTGA